MLYNVDKAYNTGRSHAERGFSIDECPFAGRRDKNAYLAGWFSFAGMLS